MRSLSREVVPADFMDHFTQFLRAYESLKPESSSALVFGYFDAHCWNLAFDLELGRLNGVYDFADCGIGDIHQEFHPLNFVSPDLTSRAIDLYEAQSDRRIDRSRVGFYTVLSGYSDLFDLESSQGTLLKKTREVHLEQVRRWIELELLQ